MAAALNMHSTSWYNEMQWQNNAVGSLSTVHFSNGFPGKHMKKNAHTHTRRRFKCSKHWYEVNDWPEFWKCTAVSSLKFRKSFLTFFCWVLISGVIIGSIFRSCSGWKCGWWCLWIGWKRQFNRTQLKCGMFEYLPCTPDRQPGKQSGRQAGNQAGMLMFCVCIRVGFMFIASMACAWILNRQWDKNDFQSIKFNRMHVYETNRTILFWIIWHFVSDIWRLYIA